MAEARAGREGRSKYLPKHLGNKGRKTETSALTTFPHFITLDTTENEDLCMSRHDCDSNNFVLGSPCFPWCRRYVPYLRPQRDIF